MQASKFTWGLIVLLVAWTTPVYAQKSELGVGEPRPWAMKVSRQEQQTAEEAFNLGNTQFQNGLFSNAVGSYDKALTHWDHPGIHYNLALALLPLQKPLEVHEHLLAALRYGGEPLDASKRKRAQELKTTIEKQITRLEITCEVAGALVKMNEELLCATPKRFGRWVLPGEYTFTATHKDHPLHHWKRTLGPGETVPLHFKLYTENELTRSDRKWAAWKPWAMLGTGVAIAAGGGALFTRARSDHQRFDAEIKARGGLVPEPPLASLRTRGDRLQRMATGAYAVGGATVMTSMVLLYINREKTRSLSPDEYEQQMSITPLIGGQRGVEVTIRY
jgi:hypothetical protein